MNEVVNHLWQSTLFAAVVAMAALALKQNQAKTRHALWVAASAKFLVPFSLLVALGTQVEIPVMPQVMPALTVEQITTSFAPVSAPRTSLVSAGPELWPFGLAALWTAGAAAITVRWFHRWRRIAAARRGATPLPIAAPIPVLAAPTLIEPGVFGIFQPVLLLPEGILEKLTPEELDAILAHELSHVRRRDNFTAALHMVVETLFWFHPLVWWIGNRMVEERERACDEAVLNGGRRAEVYAQSILNVCKFYVESPLACASGVSGADLRKRIEEIMAERNPLRLTLTRSAMLAAAGVSAVSVPFAIGLLRAQTLPPPPKYKFEVASIRPGDPNSRQVRIMPGPQGGLRTENTTALELIRFAYDLRPFQVTGGPAWIRDEKYNITGTPDQAEELPGPGMSREKFESQFNRQRQRVQALLAERFGLVLRAETREMPAYAMTLAKGGHKLSESSDGAKPVNMRVGRGVMNGAGTTVKMLTNSLSQVVGRTVIDETGLKGAYDFKLEWTPDGPEGGGPSGETGPSIFAAIQEQLGLKLESKRAPVPLLIIEKIDKPSEN